MHGHTGGHNSSGCDVSWFKLKCAKEYDCGGSEGGTEGGDGEVGDVMVIGTWVEVVGWSGAFYHFSDRFRFRMSDTSPLSWLEVLEHHQYFGGLFFP